MTSSRAPRPKVPKRAAPEDLDTSEARAQLRVRIARETGRSPFDPSVVREARRRVPKRAAPEDLDASEARAQLRVRIARETGRSPFDPSVVREVRRRVARQLDTDIEQALQDPLSVVRSALPTIYGDGRFGDRKVFIAALWDRVGRKIHMSLLEFKRWLIAQHRNNRLVLARADLVAAMPEALLERSQVKTEGDYSGAMFHFVVDPSV